MDERVELVQYLRVLQKRWKVVLLTISIIMLLAVGLNLRTAQRFSSSTTILLNSSDARAAVEDGFRNVALLERELEGEMTFARSDDVTAVVEQQFGQRDLELRISTREDVDILRFTAISESRVTSIGAANAWAQAYLDEKERTATAEVDALLASFSDRLDQLADERDLLQSGVDALQDELAVTSSASRQVSLERDIERESRRIAFRLGSIDAEVNAIAQGMTDLQIREQLLSSGSARLVERATAARLASRPLWLVGFLALFSSVLVGVGLAFARESLDDKIRTAGDIREVTEIPVIGSIPRPSSHLRGVNYDTVVRHFPGSSMAQSLLAVRNAVQFAVQSQGLDSILVTSPVAGEGKSTTVANLAYALADTDRMVLVADVDLHRSRLHESFQVPATPGLTDHLSVGVRLDDLVVDLSSSDSQLFFAPSGTKAERPSDVVGSPPFLDMLRTIAKGVDLTLLDGPPVLPVADAQALSYLADATILCVRVGRSKRSELSQAITRLRQSGGNVMAIVLVGTSAGDTYEYYSSTETESQSTGVGRMTDAVRRVFGHL